MGGVILATRSDIHFKSRIFPSKKMYLETIIIELVHVA